MWYLEDVAAHELHGPFANKLFAHAWAHERGISAWRIHTDSEAQNLHDPGSLRIVPKEKQGFVFA